MSADPIRALPAPVEADWQLWRIDLDRLPGPWPACSDDERARAARFRRAGLAERWLAAREGLRRVLGAATGLPAARLAFVVDALDKPALDAASRLGPGGDWHFNLSHSDATAVVGLRRAGPIGVDVETPRPGVAEPALVERLFTRDEQRAWHASPADARETAFMRAWTRKEACLKALGTGLSLEASAVDAGVAPDPRDVVVQLGDRPLPLRVWSVLGDGLPPCAVAVTDADAAAQAVRVLAARH